jgi:hypothetical protein
MTPRAGYWYPEPARPDWRGSESMLWICGPMPDTARPRRSTAICPIGGVSAGCRFIEHVVTGIRIGVHHASEAGQMIARSAVPINPRLKLAEIKSILERVEPVLYIGQDDLYDKVDRLPCSALGRDARVLVDTISPLTAAGHGSISYPMTVRPLRLPYLKRPIRRCCLPPPARQVCRSLALTHAGR